jgi:hypothetical protein
MNNIRTTEDTSVPDVKYYKLSHGAQYDKEVEGLLDEYTHA